jgi:hypothetical protein
MGVVGRSRDRYTPCTPEEKIRTLLAEEKKMIIDENSVGNP